MNMSLHWSTKVGDARYKSQKINWTKLDYDDGDDDHGDDDEDEDEAKLSTLGWGQNLGKSPPVLGGAVLLEVVKPPNLAARQKLKLAFKRCRNCKAISTLLLLEWHFRMSIVQNLVIS